MGITGWRSAGAGDGRSPHRGGGDESGRAGVSVTAADGLIEGDDFQGSRVERDHTAGSRTGRVAKRRGRLFEMQRAPRGSLGVIVDITDRLTAAIAIAVVTGAGQDIAVMVGVRREHEGRHRQR